jgi:hypothetical protein
MSKLDSKIPAGPLNNKWTDFKDHVRLVNPANKRSIDVIVVGTGLAGGSASKILRVVHTRLQLKVESMQQKTTKVTEIPFSVYFTTPSKVVITVQEKPTFTVWQKFPQASLTNVLHKVFLLHAITAAC